jgi:alpha-beta hydrolase superfamily lysophospholipase
MTELGLAYDRWALTASDGISLDAWHIPHSAPRGVCIVSHGYASNKGNMLLYAEHLHPLGFSIVMQDFRGNGESGGKGTTFGVQEHLDLRATISAARAAYPGLPVVLLGESMGASISLMVAAEDPDISAVIADSPFARLDEPITKHLEMVFGPKITQLIAEPTSTFGATVLGMHPYDVAPEASIHLMTDTPLLLVHGTDDNLIPVSHTHRLATAYPGDPELWFVDGTRHTEIIHLKPAEYAKKLEDFLQNIPAQPKKEHSHGH